MIFIYDSNERMQAVLSNENPDACPYRSDAHLERLNDGMLSYTFEIPANHEAAKAVKLGGFAAIRDYDNNFIMFQIVDLDDDSNNGSTVTAFCENAALELQGDLTRPINMNAITAPQALSAILTNTRWKPGIVEGNETATIIIESEQSTLKTIIQLMESFGLEVQYRVVIVGGRIVSRYVDLVERRGKWAGVRFDYKEDIAGLKRKGTLRDMATALIGKGKGDSAGDRLTFSNVVWSKANGDPLNKPFGQDWLGDPDAMRKWGRGEKHIFSVFEDSEETNPERLLKNTWNSLKDRREPSFEYEIDAVLLERYAGYEHKKVRLGDTVVVRDFTFADPVLIEARVIEITRSYSDPTQDKVILGQYRPLFTSANANLKALQRLIEQNRGKWEDGGQSYHVGDTAPNPEEFTEWLDTSITPVNVWKHWNGFTWVAATPTNADEIEETPGKNWAVEPGADKTGDHTSDDTEHVAGRPSGSIPDTNQVIEYANLARSGAIEFTTGYAEKQVYIANVPPANPVIGDKWIDTSGSYDVWKRFEASGWVETGTSDLSQLDGQIQAVQIATGAVLSEKLADLSVSLAKMQQGSVGAWQVIEKSLTGDKLVARTITAEKILAGAITAKEIAADSITSEKIGANAVTAEKIVAKSILTGHIATEGLSAEVIKFGAMSGDRIIANTIDANKLRAGTVIASDIVFTGQLSGASGTFSGSVYTTKQEGEVFSHAEVSGTVIAISDNSQFEGTRATWVKPGNIQLEAYGGYTALFNLDNAGILSIDGTSMYNTGLIKLIGEKTEISGELQVRGGKIIVGTITSRYFTIGTGGFEYRHSSSNYFRLHPSTSVYLYLYTNATYFRLTDTTIWAPAVRADEYMVGTGTYGRIKLDAADNIEVSSANEVRLTAGASMLRVHGTIAGVYVRTGNDALYAPINASEFKVNSERSAKDDIKEMGSVLNMIKGVKVYDYVLKAEQQQDGQGRYIGMMLDEAPEILADKDTINLYSTIMLLWRGMQELTEEVEQLKGAAGL